MGEVVNLRLARKAKARAAKDEAAAANRVRFGRTRAETERRDAENARAAATHDGHKLGPDEP